MGCGASIFNRIHKDVRCVCHRSEKSGECNPVRTTHSMYKECNKEGNGKTHNAYDGNDVFLGGRGGKEMCARLEANINVHEEHVFEKVTEERYNRGEYDLDASDNQFSKCHAIGIECIRTCMVHALSCHLQRLCTHVHLEEDRIEHDAVIQDHSISHGSFVSSQCRERYFTLAVTWTNFVFIQNSLTQKMVKIVHLIFWLYFKQG